MMGAKHALVAWSRPHMDSDPAAAANRADRAPDAAGTSANDEGGQ